MSCKTKNGILTFIVATLPLLSFVINVPGAGASSFNVGNGQSISDIFFANDLQPGDVINVYEGTYTEVIYTEPNDIGEAPLKHPESYAGGISLSNDNRVYFPTGPVYDRLLNTLNTNQAIIEQYYAYIYRSIYSNNGAFKIKDVDVANRYISVETDELFLDEESDGTQLGLTVAVVRPVILRNAETDPVKRANVVVHLTDWTMFFSSASDYILVDGLNFDGQLKPTDSAYIGMQIMGSDYNVIQNCTIRNIRAGEQGSGILIEATGTGADQTSYYNMVLRNKFIDTGNEYIYNGAGGHDAGDNNTYFTNIIDNEFTQKQTYPLENVIEIKEYNKGQTVEGNYIHDIAYFHPWGTVISIGNITGSSAITTDVLIYNNKINNIGNQTDSSTENLEVFYLAGAKDFKIFNNLIANINLPGGNTFYTLYYDDGSVYGTNYISNNTFHNNEVVIHDEGRDIAGTVSFNNNIISDSGLVFDYTHANQSVDYNLYWNNTTLGIVPAEHDLLDPAKPLIYASVDETEENFLHLGEGSSGIDQGVIMSSVMIDFNKNPRPAGRVWDMGACESTFSRQMGRLYLPWAVQSLTEKLPQSEIFR